MKTLSLNYLKLLFFSFILVHTVYAGSESEYNSNKYNANSVNENSTTTGSLSNSDDDFFKFIPTADSTITIQTSDYSKKMSVLLMKGCAYDSSNLTSTTSTTNASDVIVTFRNLWC